MAITPKLWDEISGIYKDILAHPFLTELAEGTLPKEKFIRYLHQDTFYLTDFARALAITAAKAKRKSHFQDLLSFAQGALSEQLPHQSMLESMGGTEEDARISPTTFTYSHFMISMAQNASFVESMAALLPCFWIYKEVGKEILSKAVPNNPYQNWIDCYADPAFAAICDRAIVIMDEAFAEVSQRIYPHVRQAFVHSTLLEGMFWDSAYRLQDWPMTQTGDERHFAYPELTRA